MRYLLPLLLACDTPPPATQPAPPVPPATYESSPAATPAEVAAEPIHVTLSFADRAQHMLDVSMRVPAEAGPLTLFMPTWTPGSYLIREYARHVEAFSAAEADGTPLPVVRSAKNRWTITVPASGTVTVQYRVYCRERSVRTNFVDADMAVLNGAPTFMAPVEPVRRPWHIDLTLPEGWTGAYTGLDSRGRTEQFIAADFDEVVDSPIVAGAPTVRALTVPGHRLVLAGPLGPWRVDQSAEDVARIVEVQQAFWGNVPYERYTFLQVVNEQYGGLEHLDSTLMQASRKATSSRDSYLGWLGLVSHEFFHTWNIKRLRPLPLGPFDYEAEVVTPSLWIAEGITSYYDDLLLVRAGLMEEDEYLSRLSKTIRRIQDTPGRLTQTLQQASADAWIKHYRPDENSVNTAVSYYSKGALVAFVLDAAIRQASDGTRSLDDVMRTAYDRHAGPEGYTPAQFEAIISEVAGVDLSPLLERCLRTTEELNYAPALAWYGLRFSVPEDDAASPDAWMGAGTADQGGRRVVTRLQRETPAHASGLQVDDELIAIDGWRVPAAGESSVLSQLAPGSVVPVTISRLGQLRTIEVTLEAAPQSGMWTLEVDDDAEDAAEDHRSDWLAVAAP